MQFSRINLTLGVILLLALIAIANSFVVAAKSPSCTENESYFSTWR
jgi:hypothetical protein